MVQQWFQARLDDALFPSIKLISRGYRQRLAQFRQADRCDLTDLNSITPPPAVDRNPERSWRGYPTESYRFPSPIICGCEENAIVGGRLITHDPKAPWVVIIPGFATGSLTRGYGPFRDLQGRLLLERGVNVALIDPPYHLTRRKKGCISGEGFFSPDLAETQSVVRQAAADVIALVRWLEVEYNRPVGLWGTSMGGCIAGLAATRLSELAGVVLMEPLDNPGDPIATIPGAWEIRTELQRNGIDPAIVPALLKDVAPSSYLPAVHPQRILFVTPMGDRVVLPQFQEAFWRAWGRPHRIAVQTSHVGLATSKGIAIKAAEYLVRWVHTPV